MQRKPKYKQKYIELQFLGKGKSGQVYKVQKIQKKTISKSSSSLSSKSSQSDCQKQFYAAKRVSLHKIDYEAAKKQLQILEHLKHMNIVRMYEDFIEDQQLIIIMDYCEGKDLEFLIQDMKKKGKYFNQSIVSTWIFQLIMAIEYIHSCNIIHRDIKPQNIFVDQKMNLKIGDFGVSKLLEGTENCKTTAGTPMYFSPELIKGEHYSKKTDVWSLGCVIFQICTLERPFNVKGGGFFQLMSAISNNEPKSIPKIYSQDLNKLIKKMLIKDPKKRPSARQLFQDPILVQLMINYSESVNLKEEYEKKPLEKPTLTDSFIEVQSNAVNQRMLKFQQQVRLKMEALKNKKVKSNQIEKYYEDIQKKMKNLQKIVDTAFQELKTRCDQSEQKNQPKTQAQSQLTKKSTISQNNSSNLSQSEETIKSINLSQKQKSQLKSQTKNNLSKKQMQQKILSMPLNQSSSIDSVNSIFIESNKNINMQKSQKNSLQQNFSRTSRQLSQMILSKKDQQQLQGTIKSQYLQTIKNTKDVNQLKDITLEHIQEISKEIQSNPNLVFDQSFLDVTLSVSNNQVATHLGNAMKKKNIDPEVSIGKSCSSSGRTLNFDFTKKQLNDPLSVSKKTFSQKTVSQGQKDSLDEYYQPDFQSYEEDKELDVRQQQRKSVKQLFTSTLKNLTTLKNESNTSNSSLQPRNKYSLTLSTIREQSSEGGSTISYNEDLE